MTADPPPSIPEVSGEWPRTANAENRTLMLSMSLGRGRDRDIPFVRYARAVLRDLLILPLEHGETIRVDIARDFPTDEEWPRRCRTTREWEDLLAWLDQVSNGAGVGPGSVYPVTAWVIPARTRAGERLIELFRVLPFDGGVLDSLLDEGVVNVSLSPAFTDLMAGPAEAERVLPWFDALRRDGRVKWDVGPYEHLDDE